MTNEEKAKQVFERYPDTDVLYFSVVGECFFKREDAAFANRLLSKPDEVIAEIRREKQAEQTPVAEITAEDSSDEVTVNNNKKK